MKKQSFNRSTELRKADEAFSLFIRTRDAQAYEGKAFKCISCGRILPIQQADDGHFCQRANMSLRFNELNNNGQCRFCNRFREGNIQDYRKGLIEKIGLQNVELLEAMKHQTHKMSATDLHYIALEYRRKVKEFEFQIK